MNTLRFAVFKSKKDYNAFMKQVKPKDSTKDDKFLHIIDCKCGNNHKTIESKGIFNVPVKYAECNGLGHVVVNGIPHTINDLDRLMEMA